MRTYRRIAGLEHECNVVLSLSDYGLVRHTLNLQLQAILLDVLFGDRIVISSIEGFTAVGTFKVQRKLAQRTVIRQLVSKLQEPVMSMTACPVSNNAEGAFRKPGGTS